MKKIKVFFIVIFRFIGWSLNDIKENYQDAKESYRLQTKEDLKQILDILDNLK